MNLKRITLDDTVEETVNKINENSTDIEENVSRLEADFIPFKDNITLKTSKIEKELNDYKATMQQVNINQEPKQKVSDYGTVSLPKNAANGQVSVTIGGQTWTNLIDGAEVAPGDSRTFDSIDGHIYFDLYNGVIIAGDGTEKTVINAGDESANMAVFDLTQIYGQGNEPTAEQAQARLHYINGTKSTISAMRIRIVSEDEAEGSTAYVLAKDEDENIEELRSLPNGVKDEVRVSGSKAEYIQRTRKYVLQESDILYFNTARDNFDAVNIQKPDDMAEFTMNSSGQAILEGYNTGIGATQFNFDSPDYVNSIIASKSITDDYLIVTFKKGKYSSTAEVRADLAGTQLIYQLATPIEIPIQTSGSLVSYPSGTVYIEPYVADAGIYTDKMEVLCSDLPIKALEKISKVDFDTGLETELDITAAVIAEDKLSFTHPDLTSGDIVFFEYEYDLESTEGETEVEFYDSRYVIKDSITDKFYKWNIVVANGQPSIELVEV